MRVNKVQNIVFSSSGTATGETPKMPVSENYGPLLPISLYGASKLASEGLMSAFCHIFDIKAGIFRFANIIGSRATHGAIFDFINKLKKNPADLEILGDGTQEKPYILVADCLVRILHGLSVQQEKCEIFNIGVNSTTTMTRIADILVEEMGLKNVRFRYTGGNRGWLGDVPQFRYNVQKMRKLGWQTSHSSDEAMHIAIRKILCNEVS